jgi:DNA-binding NarL/FixJ family response regulator
MLTTFDLDEHVYDALAAGAGGFLLKDVTAERLFDAVRVIASGGGLLAPAVTRRLISEFARLRPRDPARTVALGNLTPARPRCSASSPRAWRDRTQAVIAAYESGLVVPGRSA